MRAPLQRREAQYGCNMTPMIDIVFQLIIFFLVASHLARQETQVQLALPSAATGRRPAEEDVRRVVVNVLPEGRIQLGGQVVGPDRAAEIIAYESARADRDVEVRIRTDRRVPYRLVEPIMIACAKAGVWKVTFAVIAEK